MAATYTTRRLIEFCETDVAGIAHFTTFFKMMESTEHELLRHLGSSVLVKDTGTTISWPRVSATCDFLKPVRFEDEVDIEVSVDRLGTKSVTYGFVFFHDSEQVARGSITSVCCRVEPGTAPSPVPIPDQIASRLATYVTNE